MKEAQRKEILEQQRWSKYALPFYAKNPPSTEQQLPPPRVDASSGLTNKFSAHQVPKRKFRDQLD